MHSLLFTREDKVDSNFYYVTGLNKSMRISAYAVTGKGKPIVITNALEYGTLAGSKNIRAIKAESKAQLERLLRKNLKTSVGLNYDYVSLNAMRKLKLLLKGRKFHDISRELHEMRGVKTREEIRKIKEACRITEKIFAHLQSITKPGVLEIAVTNELEAEAKRLGAEGFSFPPIIASGANSAVPHYRSGRVKIEEGILLADIGVIYEGYCSDLTRTYCIGEPTVMLKHMYAVVNKARENALHAARHGAKSRNVFDEANGVIKQNYKSDMIHSIGHGLGIDVHDHPEPMSPKNNFSLKQNMCLTIEPGYYQEGFGGMRIEDDIVITKGKPKMLSNAPDKLVCL